jgi:hypothetical protein
MDNEIIKTIRVDVEKKCSQVVLCLVGIGILYAIISKG